MNERQLKSFVTAADLKSFAQAAKTYGVTSPALINQVNILEKDLGFTLFDRNTHGIELTKEGEVFYRAAKKIMGIYEEAVEECKLLNASRSIRIGLADLLLPVISPFGLRFKQEHPEYTVKFFTMLDSEIASAHLRSQVNLTYTAEPAQKEMEEHSLKFFPVREANLYVLVPKQHPLAQETLVTAEMLKNYMVEVKSAPMRKRNSEDVMTQLGIPHHNHGEINPQHFINMMLENKVVLSYDIVGALFANQCVSIPTDISAGLFGFAAKEEDMPSVELFIQEVSKWFEAL